MRTLGELCADLGVVYTDKIFVITYNCPSQILDILDIQSVCRLHSSSCIIDEHQTCKYLDVFSLSVFVTCLPVVILSSWGIPPGYVGIKLQALIVYGQLLSCPHLQAKNKVNF